MKKLAWRGGFAIPHGMMMSPDDLHNHPKIADLIVAHEQSIDPSLVEKDCWIMHCLYGLQKLDMKLELKRSGSEIDRE